MGTKLGTTGTSTPHDSDMAYPPGMELHGSKWRIKKRVPQDLLRKHPDIYPSQFLTLKTDESDRRAAASRAWVWLVTLPLESVSHSCAHAQASRGWLASQCSSNCTGLT